MLTLIVVTALTLLAFLSYSRHRAAVILLAGLLPTYLLRFSVFGLPTNFLELAIVIVALTGLFQPAIRSDWRIAWRRLPFIFIIPVALFIFAASASVYVSPHLLTSFGAIKSWILIPILFGWLIYAGSFRVLVVSRALLISGAAVSVIGLFQVFTLDRIKSVYDVPNSLALFLAPLLIIALWQKRWLYAAPMALAILATQSVAALAAVITTLFIGVILCADSSARKRSLAALALFIILAAGYTFSTGRLAYLIQFPNSISVRRQLWSISRELIREHPIAGVGLGTFEPAYQQKLHERFMAYQGARQDGGQPAPLSEFVFRDPHNWILSFWLNTGLLGLLAFTSLNLWTIRQPRVARWKDPSRGTSSTQCDCDRRLGRRPARQDPRQAQAITLALLALVLFGLADTIYFKNDLAALHWTLIALLFRDRSFAAFDRGRAIRRSAH